MFSKGQPERETKATRRN